MAKRDHELGVKDAKPDEAKVRADWRKVRRAETQYGVGLRRIAKQIGDLINLYGVKSTEGAHALATALRRYAETLDPWARRAAERMVLDVDGRTRVEWKRLAHEMGHNVRELFASDDAVALRIRELMAEQVHLIKSLPLDAAERVQHVAQEGVIRGARFETIAREIERGGEVSKSKATLIARTETGRVTTALTQARAESTGSVGYAWRTVQDADVRPSHRAMEGKFVAWDTPPTLDGLKGHAGALPNCRCWCEPIIPLNIK
ncbi:phage head morphogenesis protein [Rhodoblastus sp.]|uniref:phage head morphogenesis protein n=1 Tax=Rhodoblastus sp. TaxID=1962975 RepID=UPI003F955175